MEKKGFKIISDSCCDLPKGYCGENDIGIVPLYVAFEDGEYKRDFFDFTYHEFYQRMMDHPGDFPRTSLPGIEVVDTKALTVFQGLLVKAAVSAGW